MPTLTSKLPRIGTTIFSVMSQLAADEDAINLSQGYPDFDVPAPLQALLTKYVSTGHNQYPPMAGVPYLREQIARKNLALYGVEDNPETEITVTSGATEALFVAIQTLVSPGDEVIVFDPAYDSYDPAISLCQGVARHLPLTAPDFTIDWQRLQDSLNANTRLIILNSPHNPTGSVLSTTDLDRLACLLRDTDIHVLADEVYEHMVFDGRQHHSLLGHAELRQRSLVASSFGKTFHATGWKVGYCVAPAALTTEFRKIHQYVTFTTHTPTQWALAEYLDQQPDHYLTLGKFYQDKRDTFVNLMQDSAFTMTPSAGTYFQLVDYSALSNLPDTAFARLLTSRYKVAAIPVSVFYETPPEQKLVRFCFAKQTPTLAEAAKRLCAIAAALETTPT